MLHFVAFFFVVVSSVASQNAGKTYFYYIDALHQKKKEDGQCVYHEVSFRLLLDYYIF